MARCKIELLPKHGVLSGRLTAKLFSAAQNLPGHHKWVDGALVFAHTKANLDKLLAALDDDVELIDSAGRLQELKEAHGQRQPNDMARRVELEYRRKPWKHQTTAVAWGLPRTFGMFRMGVGTGKSYTMTLHGAELFGQNAIDRMLIVTRPIVKDDFLYENLPDTVPKGIRWSAHDITTERKPTWTNVDKSRFHIGLCTPQLFTSAKGRKLIDDFVRGGRCGIFVDEAHDFSNPMAKRTKYLDDVIAQCVVKFFYTGTLTPRGLENLYSQYRLLHEDIIGHGSYTSFKNEYCIMGGFENKEIVNYRSRDRLMSLIAPHTHYVDIRDCFDMPSQSWDKLKYALRREHQDMFNEIANNFTTMLREAKKQLDELIAEFRAGKVSRELAVKKAKEAMEYSRVVNSAAAQHVAMRGIMHGWFRPDPLLGPDGKPLPNQPPAHTLHYDRVQPIIDEMLDDRRPIFVWCAYRDDVALVQEAFKLAGHDTGLVIGGMTTDQKREVLDLGKRNEIRAIIGTQGAGGTGVNGQFASVSCFFSNSYSWGNREQTEGRTWRAGQTLPCFYYDSACVTAGARAIDAGYTRNLRGKRDIDLSLRGFLKMASALEKDDKDGWDESGIPLDAGLFDDATPAGEAE